MPKLGQVWYNPQPCSVLPEVLLREKWQLSPSYLDKINKHVSKTHYSRDNISGFLARPRPIIAFSQMLMKSES